jgi:nucleoside-diphosphate-sugar epimerase
MSKEKETILVTGASGFIGQFVIDQLLHENKFEIHAVSRSIQVKSNVNWHQFDLLNVDVIDNLLSDLQIDYIIHLGWETTHGKFWNSNENLKWFESSCELLRCFQKYGGKRFVGAGTCAEYKWDKDVYSEEALVEPATIYGKYKNAFHMFLKEYSKNFGFSHGWGRVFFCYGDGGNQNRLIPSVIRALKNNEKFVCKTPDLIRDFLHVEDLANGFIKLLLSDYQGVVNIASGEGIKIRDLLEKLSHYSESDSKIQYEENLNKTQPLKMIADVSLLKSKLQWQSKYNIELGLKEMVNE